MSKTHSLKAALFAAAITFSLAGCSDTLAPNSSEFGPSPTESVDGSKFRNEKFVRRAMRKRVGKDGAEDYVGVIINVQSGVSSQKVLERLKVLERFKVLERGSYEEVFNGLAVEIVDLQGNQDYTELFLALLDDSNVVWFEPDMTIEMPPSDRSHASGHQKIPWSVVMVGGTTSWTNSGNGSGTVDVDVYVLDTGILSADINIVEHRIFSSDSLNEETMDGHGTHVAGIIGAIDNSYGIVGIAPGARIHDFKVLNDDGTAPTSVVLDAVEELMARKAKDLRTPMVVNMSLGENVGPEETSLDVAVSAAVSKGITVIASAGNWGIDVQNVTPARAEGVITVGSHGMTGVFSNFSNYGSGIDILAPGESIVSLKGGSSSIVEMSGTSMAAAHVTGAAAMYLARNARAKPADVLNWIRSNEKQVGLAVPAQTTRGSVWVGEGTSWILSNNLNIWQSNLSANDQSANDQSSAKRLLFVVESPSALPFEDTVRREAFESWGYRVKVVGASSDLTETSSLADVVFVSNSVDPKQVGSKLNETNAGVVSEESGLASELGLARTGVDATKKLATMRINRSKHVITSNLGVKSQITAKQEVTYFSGVGSGVDVLGKWGGRPALLALEAGARRIDRSSAPGRRVMLPLGTPSFKYSQMKTTGVEIWKRSIAWAAGE